MHDWLQGTRRVAEAISGTPDCVPIYGPLPDHAMCMTGVSSKAFYTDPDLFVEAQLLLTEYYGLDLPYLEGDIHNIEAEALGRRIIFRPGAAPLLDPQHLLVESAADLDRIRTPDFDSAGRMPFMLKTYEAAARRTGLPALRWFCAPFSLACEVMGFSQLLDAMRHDPAFVRALLDALIERVLMPWVERGLQNHPGAWAATGVDHWASFPVITWSMFQEYVVPPAHRMRDHFGPLGYRVVVQSGWGDSYLPDPSRLFEERIRLQGALRGLDPDVQLLGPEVYAAAAQRHRVALGLGIDSALIHDGPVGAIVARIRDYILKAGPRGRLTLIINNVPGDTPPEHIHAAVAAVRFYGRYPLVDETDAPPFEMPDVEPFADFARRCGWKPGAPIWESVQPDPLSALTQAIVDGEVGRAAAEAARCLEADIGPQQLFEGALLAGMKETGRLWNEHIHFVPDVIMSSEAFKAAVRVIEGHHTRGGVGKAGTVVIGVVRGDIHDLGKSIVAAMLLAAGFEVVDLGVDVSTQVFVEAVAEYRPDILGIGAYLSTTMNEMRDVIAALNAAGLRSSVKVLVGGVPTTQSLADSIGADAWGSDAAATVTKALRLVGAEGGVRDSPRA